MQILRREFKSYTDDVEKSMKLFKDKVDLVIMLITVQIQIQDSGIKNIILIHDHFCFYILFKYDQGSTRMEFKKQKSCGAGYETNTLPGYMSTLYNHDDPFAVCLVHNSFVKFIQVI